MVLYFSCLALPFLSISWSDLSCIILTLGVGVSAGLITMASYIKSEFSALSALVDLYVDLYV